jgi:predicted secreted protein
MNKSVGSLLMFGLCIAMTMGMPFSAAAEQSVLLTTGSYAIPEPLANFIENGTQFGLALDCNPSTGEHWIIKSYDKDYIKPISETFVQYSNKTGSGGMSVFGFEGINPGSTIITMEKLDHDQKVIETRFYEIDIYEWFVE